MSEFRWNSGGSLHGKDWEEHLPTDSAVSIVLQLSVYTVCLHEVVLPHIHTASTHFIASFVCNYLSHQAVTC